jgi:hypothetical protein
MRKLILTAAGAAALAFGALAVSQRNHVRSSPLLPPNPSPFDTPPSDTPPVEITDTTRTFLLKFILPLWMAAGVADWLCHRKSDIQHTAGPAESGMHLLMLSEAAIPVLAGLFLEITSPVLLVIGLAFLAHEATALWDVTYASKHRTVTPIEQHVHSYLEMVPLMAASFVAVLHWPQLLGLAGVQGYPRDWSIRRKQRPLPGRTVASLLVGMTLLEWGPYIEELSRTLRTRLEHEPSK